MASGNERAEFPGDDVAVELILGANGYLGQFLAKARRGCDCVLHSRTDASPSCAATGLPFVREDLVESRRLLGEVDPETVYLLARPVTQDAGVLIDFMQNIQWLLQEWADRGCLKRVVFASTQLVYATPANDTPLPVNSPLGPETAYDCHKAEMEFFLALLAHHKNAVRVENYRLPLLAGRAGTDAQMRQQFLYQWRLDYLEGRRWVFPEDDGRHRAWGNSWVHVDEVVRLMIVPRGGEAGGGYAIVQPVSGHLSYVAMDAFFRERYELPEMREAIHLPKTSFYLSDNAGLRGRGIAEAYADEMGVRKVGAQA